MSAGNIFPVPLTSASSDTVILLPFISKIVTLLVGKAEETSLRIWPTLSTLTSKLALKAATLLIILFPLWTVPVMTVILSLRAVKEDNFP